jgi:predicted nucleic acid-binding protein
LLCQFPSQIIEKVRATKEQLVKAMKLSKESALSINDAIHAILAKDNNAVLVTRDRHFRRLQTTRIIRSPEELI